MDSTICIYMLVEDVILNKKKKAFIYIACSKQDDEYMHATNRSIETWKPIYSTRKKSYIYYSRKRVGVDIIFILENILFQTTVSFFALNHPLATLCSSLHEIISIFKVLANTLERERERLPHLQKSAQSPRAFQWNLICHEKQISNSKREPKRERQRVLKISWYLLQWMIYKQEASTTNIYDDEGLKMMMKKKTAPTWPWKLLGTIF